MNCDFCKLPFNLTNKLPLIIPCCGGTACKECIINQAGGPQQSLFTCPLIECKHENQDLTTLKPNKHLEKILKQSIGILCDQHLQNYGEFYCSDDRKFVCAACIISTHKGHTCTQVDKQDIINYNNKVLEFLKIEVERINQIINEIEQYQNNEKQLTSQQYSNIIKDSLDILNSRLNKQDKEQINFIWNISKDQIEKEELKISEQQQQQHKDIKRSKLIMKEDLELLKEYLNTDSLKLKLLYRGTQHGFTAQAFHERCDNQGPTLTVAKSEHDQVFGGYTSVSWESVEQDVEDPEAFLFSLTKKFKLTQYQNEDQAVWHDPERGPCFGGGTDLGFGDEELDFNEDQSCWSDFHMIDDHTYRLPDDIVYEIEAQEYLAGSYQFKLKEIDVFSVIM